MGPLRQCAAIVFVVTLAACGSETPTQPSGDWIDLNALSPAGGATLTAGERVTFTATVTCTVVSTDGGMVALVLGDQGNRSLYGAGEPTPMSTLPRGTTTVTLSGTITVPPSGSTVNLTLPLFVNGSNSTRALKRATYSVR